MLGAVTHPVKLCRTIICGSEANVRVVEKMLNILTYFIRSSDIRRNSHTKIFNKDEINKMVNQQMNFKKSVTNSSVRMRKTNGLIRSSSTVKNLNSLSVGEHEEIVPIDFSTREDRERYLLLSKTLKKNVMNDVPKVLAFRDSRFVQQELRIGNKSMDTGIEMNAKDKAFLSKYINKIDDDEEIKLTITYPDDDFHNLSSLITAKSLGHPRIDEEDEEHEHVEFVLGENERLVLNDGKYSENNNSKVKCDSCETRNTVKSFLDVPSTWDFDSNSGSDDDKESSDSNFETLNIIDLPLLESVQSQSIQDEIIKPGFTSSLFSSTCDRYISDMILQVGLNFFNRVQHYLDNW